MCMLCNQSPVSTYTKVGWLTLVSEYPKNNLYPSTTATCLKTADGLLIWIRFVHMLLPKAKYKNLPDMFLTFLNRVTQMLTPTDHLFCCLIENVAQLWILNFRAKNQQNPNRMQGIFVIEGKSTKMSHSSFKRTLSRNYLNFRAKNQLEKLPK